MSRIEVSNGETPPPASGLTVKSRHEGLVLEREEKSGFDVFENNTASERSYLSVLPARNASLSQRAPAPHRVRHGDVSTRQAHNLLVAFDERYSPIFVTTFEGRLDLDSVVWHDDLSTKAIANATRAGRRSIHIVDARRVEVPNAQLRRYWATRIQQSTGTLETMLGTFVVIDSPLLRGALTAIHWLCNEGRRIEYFSTLAAAVAIADLRLAALGHAPTKLEASNYRVAMLEERNKSATGAA